MRCLWFASVLCVSTLVDCNTVKVGVPVERPAKFPLTKYEYLTVEPVKGGSRYCADIEESIKAAMFNKGFQLLTVGEMEALVREKPKEILRAGAIVSGRVKEAGAWRGDVTYQKLGTTEPVIEYTQEHQGQVSFSMQVIDINRTLIAPPVTYEGLHSVTRKARGGHPSSPSERDLVEPAIAEASAKFMKDIAPYTEHRSVVFFKANEVPELQRGSSAVKRGDWSTAIELFETAVKKSEALAAAGGK